MRLKSFKDAKFAYAEYPGSYMYPSWFTPSVDDAPDAQRKVVIDNIPDGAAVVECRRWTNAFDSVTPTVLSSARFTKLQVRNPLALHTLSLFTVNRYSLSVSALLKLPEISLRRTGHELKFEA